MIEFNKTTIIRNAIVSILFGIVLPFYVISSIDPTGIIFDLELIISNGILFALIYTAFGLFPKHYFIRLVIGFGYIFTVIYFYSVGSNLFTVFLPHCEFGTICYEGELFGLSLSAGFDYTIMIVILLILKTMNLVRLYLKPVEEEPEIEIKL